MNPSKPFLVPSQLTDLATAEALLRQPMQPEKQHMLTELLRLLNMERKRRVMGNDLELHPDLTGVIRQRKLKILRTSVPDLERILSELTGTMKNTHLKEHDRKGDHPCDFDNTCLMAGILGVEVNNSKGKIEEARLRANSTAMPSGLIVAKHFSPTHDLAFLAVRRMLGQDGQHLSGSTRTHYDDFFPVSAW
jgi:hypothetical protein